MADPPLYVMSPEEIVFGYLFGHLPTDGTRPAPSGTPRDVLERVVRRALERPPCGVAFSGGRDSSAVLAVAVHVARRDGLPLPVPITRVFPQAPESEESEWQEAVIRHLGLAEWERVVIDDELDLVGPRAQQHLRAHGVLWPPMVHADGPLLDRLTGGTLVDGEGGDEVLGVEAHRIAPVNLIARAPRSTTRTGITAAAAALAPRSVRAQRERGRIAAWPLTWLRPAAFDVLLERFAEAEAERPLSYAASVLKIPRRRTQAMMALNRRTLGRSADVAVFSPLIDPDVVASLAVDGGRLGRGSRTAVLRALVPDLLPDAVLSRVTKATFNEAYLGRLTAEFADRWSGEGLDDDLVDRDELRRHWRSDDRVALTAALLQRAWLHDDQCTASRERDGA